MSSGYVRTLVKGWAAASPTPFYDTVNNEVAPNDALWFTIEWEVENSETLTHCGDEQEDGVIELVFCAMPGTGDAAAIAAAETEARRMLAQRDPAGKLELVRVMPVEEFSAGDGDNWYRVIAGVEYVHRP